MELTSDFKEKASNVAAAVAICKAKFVSGLVTSDFIINNRKLTIHGPDDQVWLMRQPTVDELMDAHSAYEIGYEKVIKNEWLGEFADKDDSLLVSQAVKRGRHSEAMYIMPFLIQDESGQDLFNMYDEKSRQDFQEKEKSILILWNDAWVKIASLSDEDVKKK